MTLYINACVRADSRTDRIARALLDRLDGPVEEVRLADADLRPLSAEELARRTARIAAGDYRDGMFDYARQFAAADTVVIAAPYWDLSYPACLKVYLERIYVIGLVSVYGPDGVPRGLCRANRLFYVTTAGGPYLPDYSYDHIRTLAVGCFGIPHTELIKADMLDVEGVDAEAVVAEAIRNVQALSL